ncbi:hypothetical protein QFZ56_005314 [Streptomyces achromogenes]|uniref:Uncharacterized protein n=1 Tax=Streptomyces achromogenes TaxID=67255 RepID=A0ABU0Q859_STRAH|nr:hypothetical protein [Streptomyces achromogenes]
MVRFSCPAPEWARPKTCPASCVATLRRSYAAVQAPRRVVGERVVVGVEADVGLEQFLGSPAGRRAAPGAGGGDGVAAEVARVPDAQAVGAHAAGLPVDVGLAGGGRQIAGLRGDPVVETAVVAAGGDGGDGLLEGPAGPGAGDPARPVAVAEEPLVRAVRLAARGGVGGVGAGGGGVGAAAPDGLGVGLVGVGDRAVGGDRQGEAVRRPVRGEGVDADRRAGLRHGQARAVVGDHAPDHGAVAHGGAGGQVLDGELAPGERTGGRPGRLAHADRR